MTDQKTMNSLKKLIRKQIAEAKDDDGPKSMHEMGVALTKAASASLKTLDNLKSKAKVPSRKAQAAIDSHVAALEHLFNNMWQDPMSYMDHPPDEVVAQRRADLADRESSLVDHASAAVQETSRPDEGDGQNPNLISDPTHCDTCGVTYDKKVHAECPGCTRDVREWANKLKNRKTAR